MYSCDNLMFWNSSTFCQCFLAVNICRVDANPSANRHVYRCSATNHLNPTHFSSRINNSKSVGNWTLRLRDSSPTRHFAYVHVDLLWPRSPISATAELLFLEHSVCHTFSFSCVHIEWANCPVGEMSNRRSVHVVGEVSSRQNVL